MSQPNFGADPSDPSADPSASETGKAISRTFPLDLLSASSKRLLRTCRAGRAPSHGLTEHDWIGCWYQGIYQVLDESEWSWDLMKKV